MLNIVFTTLFSFFYFNLYKLIKLLKGDINFNSNQKLSQIIKFLSISYDYIIIDSPPSLGLLTENFMATTTDLIIPMELEDYSIQGISTIKLTYDELKKIIKI